MIDLCVCAAEKAILGESLTGEEQGKAFAYFSIAWGLGALLGPLLGGIFSFPCSQAGGMLQSTALCHEDSLLQRRYVHGQTPSVSPSIRPLGIYTVPQTAAWS